MVFYRKYRPQKIEELDLEGVREKIFSILRSQDIPHAFLFAGPKGLGKTSAARILAKAINCEKRLSSNDKKSKIEAAGGKSDSVSETSLEPCNTCSACISITNGSNLDVLEIDAASNRGIDEIRDLRDKIRFAPTSLAKKVYIIDEVHMLTPEAFNALLKTLEEPPDHAIFILCTTEPWRLPETVVSRAFLIQFERPKKEELRRSIERIISQEGIEMDEEVFDSIYEVSEGSFRDAAKMLEEIALFAQGQRITKALFDEKFRFGEIEKGVASLVGFLSRGEFTKALLLLEKMAGSGFEAKVVAEKMAQKLHKLFLETTTQKKEDAVFSQEDLIFLLEKLQEAYQYTKIAPVPFLPLELVVIEFKLKKEKQDISVPDKQTATKLTKNEISSNAKPKNANSSSVLLKLIDRMNVKNPAIAALLRGCRIKEEKDNLLVLSVRYPFHFEKLNKKGVLSILEDCLSEIYSKKMKIEMVQE
jgi:DNA polymerase-3 subunit gamma/tau